MRLNKCRNRVIIETTNMKDGCIESGGVVGRVVSYNVFDVMGCLGEYALESLHLDDPAPFRNGVTRRQAIEAECYGHLVRRGSKAG